MSRLIESRSDENSRKGRPALARKQSARAGRDRAAPDPLLRDQNIGLRQPVPDRQCPMLHACPCARQELCEAAGVRGRYDRIGGAGQDQHRLVLKIRDRRFGERDHRAQQGCAGERLRPEKQERRGDIRTVREAYADGWVDASKFPAPPRQSPRARLRDGADRPRRRRPRRGAGRSATCRSRAPSREAKAAPSRERRRAPAAAGRPRRRRCRAAGGWAACRARSPRRSGGGGRARSWRRCRFSP